MGLPRATFFFDDNEFSWTETYYSSVANISLADMLPAAVQLGKLRTALLSSLDGDTKFGPSLNEIRVSMDDTFRDSLIDTSTARGGKNAGYLGDLAANKGLSLGPSRPYSVILLRCESGTLYRKSLYLSGAPIGVVTDPAGPVLGNNAIWADALAKFFTALLPPQKAGKVQGPSSWGFKAQSNEDGVAPLKDITNVVVAPGGGFTTVTIPGHGFAAIANAITPLRVRIRGVKYDVKDHGVNGTHSFSVVDANTIKVFPKTRVFASNNYLPGTGKARQVYYDVFPFTNIILKGETHRKRGVRSGRPAGRSKSPGLAS